MGYLSRGGLFILEHVEQGSELKQRGPSQFANTPIANEYDRVICTEVNMFSLRSGVERSLRIWQDMTNNLILIRPRRPRRL